MPKALRSLLFIVLLILSQTHTKAQDRAEKFVMIHPLVDEWQVYDENYQAYVPYLSKRHQNPRSVSFWLELGTYKDFSLVFYAGKDMYFFINNRLCKNFTKEGWVVFQLDSLGKRYGNKSIFCTFFDKQRRLPLKQLFIGYALKKKEGKTEEAEPDEGLPVYKRQSGIFKNYMVFSTLFLLTFFVVLKNYDLSTFREFFDLGQSMLGLTRRNRFFVSKLLSFYTLLMLSFHAFILSFFFIYLGYYFPQMHAFSNPESTFWGFLYQSLSSFAWFFLLMFGKYFLILVFGYLLGLERQVNHHFFEYIRLSLIFYTAISLVFILGFFTLPFFGVFPGSIIWYSLYVFHIFQSILVSFYMVKQSNYRSLYLFYYLCITELTPLLVILKVLSLF